MGAGPVYGRVKAFHGHFGMHIRAYTYIRLHGAPYNTPFGRLDEVNATRNLTLSCEWPADVE